MKCIGYGGTPKTYFLSDKRRGLETNSPAYHSKFLALLLSIGSRRLNAVSTLSNYLRIWSPINSTTSELQVFLISAYQMPCQNKYDRSPYRTEHSVFTAHKHIRARNSTDRKALSQDTPHTMHLTICSFAEGTAIFGSFFSLSIYWSRATTRHNKWAFGHVHGIKTLTKRCFCRVS